MIARLEHTMHEVTLVLRDMVMLTGDIDQETEKSIDDACRYEPEGTFFIQKKFPKYDGVHLYRHRIFPIGLLERVGACLASHNYHVTIDDKRHPAIFLKQPITKFEDINLYPYQNDAAEKWLNRGRHGIVKIPTGGGKTRLGVYLISRLKETCLILVPGKDLLYQWHKEIKNMLGVPAGLIGDGRCDIQEITIATYQTVERALGESELTRNIKNAWAMEEDDTDISTRKSEIAKFLRNVGLLIIDEVHRAGARTLLKCAVSTHCRYALGLSATPLDRPDNSNLAVIASCGEILYDIPMSNLIEEGYLCPLEIRIRSTGGLERIHREKSIREEKDLEERKRLSLVDYRKIKNEYVHGDERIKIVVEETMKLWNEGRTTLVLATEIKYGQKLAMMLSERTGTGVPFVQGKVLSKKRKEVIDKLEKGEMRLAVATSVFELGLDVPRLNGLVIASPSKSAIRTVQRVGRILRKHPDKKDAVLVDFDDTNAAYFSEQSLERVKFYTSEKSFKIMYDGTSKRVLNLLNKDKDLAEFDMAWKRGAG